MPTTKIEVQACDNELYILASQPAGSSELLHIKSGYGAPVSNIFNPQHILPKGQYTLTMVGINWGGPQAFKVIVTTDGSAQTYTAPGGSGVGVVWSKSVPMTI